MINMRTLLRGRMTNVPIILTRWVLVISISYAIIFSHKGAIPFWPHQLFVAVILASNLLLGWVLSRGKSWRVLSSWATGLDIAAVSMAISVAGNVDPEFYLVYFSILILSAVVNRLDVLIVMALLACASYGVVLYFEPGGSAWIPELLVRLPVLFGVALYFGTAVRQARREYKRQAEQLTIERGKALSALTEMGNVALSGGYPGPVLYEIAGWVQEIVGFDRCSLIVFGEGGEQGYLAASGDDASIEVLTLEMANYPELGPVLQRGEFTEIHPNNPPGLWEEVGSNLPEGSPFSTFIVIPIKRAASVTGAFYLRDSNPERTLSEAQREFAFQAAQMAAAFIHEHDLLSQLQRRSRHDLLTGLMNYQSFTEEAQRLVAVGAHDGPISMAIVDIDNIRDVNKEFGHDAGNTLIASVGEQLASGLAEASICRYAGDEFLALIHCTTADAKAVLQRSFLDQLGEAQGNLPSSPRASVGIAGFPHDGDDPESLLEAAEHALRLAKDNGGHQIQVYASEPDA